MISLVILPIFFIFESQKIEMRCKSMLKTINSLFSYIEDKRKEHGNNNEEITEDTEIKTSKNKLDKEK